MEPTAVQAAIDKAMKDTKTELVGEFNKEINKKNEQIKELSAKVNELSGKLTEATNKQNTKKALGEGKQEDCHKLQDNATKDQFKHWLTCVNVQIEKTESWGYWSRVLKIIRLTK